MVSGRFWLVLMGSGEWVLVGVLCVLVIQVFSGEF